MILSACAVFMVISMVRRPEARYRGRISLISSNDIPRTMPTTGISENLSRENKDFSIILLMISEY
jgi:hypothetical protein